MVYHPVKRIPAYDLRAIALLTIESMKNPAHCTSEHLSTDRNGNSVSVFSEEAAILSEIGHIYRAGMSHFGFKSTTKVAERDDKVTNTLNCVVRDLDAQVRLISKKNIDGRVLYTSMVTHWVDSGPETVISLLEKAAARLEIGDAALISPHDVGVMIDIPDEKRRKKVESVEDNEIDHAFEVLEKHGLLRE